MSRTAPNIAVILDVDGVVSPVHPDTLPWGDEVRVGDVFGPVLVSPTLVARLDALHRHPGVECWWLTSWTSTMRARMDLFPGRDWGVVAEGGDFPGSHGWWKLECLAEWLSARSLTSLAWADDDLRGGRCGAVHRVLSVAGVDQVLLTRPRTAVGLTPEHVSRIEHWVDARRG